MRKNSRIFMIFFLVILLCTGCGAEKTEGVLLHGEENAFTDAILSAHPDWTGNPAFTAHPINYYGSVRQGDALVCMDAQIFPAAVQLKEQSFLPQAIVTVVLAIDREQTGLSPSGWQQLQEAGLPVSITTNGIRGAISARAFLASAAYGLEGGAYTLDTAVRYFRELNQKGLLRLNDSSAPVVICFDTEAVSLIRQGRKLEIIVPEEGTLSFVYGLLGRPGMTGASDGALLSRGLRLPDGRCSDPAYPSADAYQTAVRVPDFRHFAQETEAYLRSFRRGVLHNRLLSSADGMENILFSMLIILAIIIWTGSALFRSIQRRMRLWIWAISGQTVAWITISAFKYMLPYYSSLTQLLWYAYYLFLLGLPLTALYIAISADQNPRHLKIPGWFRPFPLLYLLFIVMVFTNDLHQFVFRLEYNGEKLTDYKYGPGYYLVFVYALLTFLLSLALLIRKSRHSPKKLAWFGPVSAAIALIVFNIAYICDLPLARQNNLTMVFCTFSILFVESVLHAGMVPSNTKYQHFFSFSPLNMQLTTPGGVPVLAASRAEPLTDGQKKQISQFPEIPLLKDPDTLLHSRRINGGLAIWQEDISAMNELQEKLRLSIEQNKIANSFLQKEEDILRQKLTAEINTQIFDQLEAEINEQLRNLTETIHALPSAPEPEREMARVTLMLCHIKRRCNLFFLSQEGSRMSGDEFAVYIDELSEFASYAGIQALCRSGISGSLPVSTVTLCYDFYFSVLSLTIAGRDATVLGRIEGRGGWLTFDILTSEPPGKLQLPDSFRMRLQNAGGAIICKETEDMDGICLSVPERE